MPVAEAIAARAAAAVAAASADSTPDDAKTAPPDKADTSGVESVPAGGVDASKTAPEKTPVEQAADAREKELAAKREVIEQKLAAERARNEARRQARVARDHSVRAEADRNAAAQERQKYEALRQGNFKEVLTAMGRDPRKVFEEMQAEAIEAGTPEAQIRAMRADFERQMGEKLGPLTQAIAELKKERDAARADAEDGRLRGAYAEVAKDAAFTDLRISYSDDELLGFARHFATHPDAFHAAAKQYKIPLTAPERGFTMHEILTVLKAAEAEHTKEQQSRRQQLAPQSPAVQATASAPTVNGSQPKPETGKTIGNDLASERASSRGRRLSRAERIDSEIRRLDKR